jgi:type VI secretion system secreted protein VgrG
VRDGALEVGVRVLPKLELEGGDLPLEPRQLTARERMSEPFSVLVVALSERPDLDLSAVVGRGAGIGAWGELGFSVWTGICRRMALLRAEDATTGMSTYELVIVPRLALLAERSGHRIFQHLSTPDIVRKILAEYGIEPELRLAEPYPRHEYRVQYGESDLAFCERLLEEAGISYWFDRRLLGGGDRGGRLEAESVLVLGDGPQHGASLGPIDYFHEPSEGRRNKPFVTNVRLGDGVKAGKVTLADYDPRKPDLEIREASTLVLPDADKLEAGYERYRHRPGIALVEVDKADDKLPVADARSIARRQKEHAARQATVELEAERAPKRTVELESNHPSLAPGQIFSIDQHPRPDLASDRALLVVETLVQATVGDWSLTLTAVFAAAPYRPERRTPKPRALGPETAIVVGPEDKEIHADELGRIRVRFPWDREGKFDDGASTWLRTSQAWAGARWGMTHQPRVGQEVIVDFLDGDPDHPVVVGSLFSGTTRPPRKLPDAKTQSIWRSATSPETAGAFNEVSFEDQAGSELLFVQAQRDLLRLTKNDETERTGRDRIVVVGEGRVAAVADDDTVQAGGRQLVRMVTAKDLKIPDMGDPEVEPRDTWLEIAHERITLTTGKATIELDGSDIVVHAKGGLRLSTDGRLVMQGSTIFLNAGSAGAARPSTRSEVEDAVRRPGRVLGAIAKLFAKAHDARALGGKELTVDLTDQVWMPKDMPPLVKKHRAGEEEPARGEIFEGELFVDGVSVDDVKQGAIGDCYLAAAMGALAYAAPGEIEKRMKDNGDGTVSVRLGQGQEVKVDKELPTLTGQPLYAKSTDPKEMWPALLEKAYAYEFGGGEGYQGIVGGWPGNAVRNITGWPKQTSYLGGTSATNPKEREALLATLSQADKKPTAASSRNPTKNDETGKPRYTASGRIIGDHSYTVLGTSKSADGKDMVVLRNPWARKGDGNPYPEGKRPGEFEMPLEDFAEDFYNVDQSTPS